MTQTQPCSDRAEGQTSARPRPAALRSPSTRAYPLNTPWSFWYTAPNTKGVKYLDRIFRLGTFDSLETFLPLYSYIIRPGSLSEKSILSLHRNDGMPLWETYPKGGRWMIMLRRPSSDADRTWLNRLWEQVVFALISESFKLAQVVGADMEVRPNVVSFTLWLSETKSSVRYGASDHLRKTVLHLEPGATIEWKTNADAMKDDSGHAFVKVFATVMSPTGQVPAALPEPKTEQAEGDTTSPSQ